MFSKLFSNKHLIIILFSLIILVILMGITVGNRDLTWPEKLVKDSVSWAQGVINKPANAIAGFFEDIREFRLIFEENKALKYTLNQYSQVKSDLNDLKEENNRLREMLDYKEKTKDNYKLRIAQVIARSPDRWNNMLVINKGLNDGIRKNMAVVTTQGLIGKVYSVSSFSANVQLITDNEHSGFVFAQVQSEPRIYGIVEGYDKEKNQLAIKKIDLNARIEPGLLVTTSNLGGVFPSGIVIGEIVDVEEGENGGLTKTAYIKPSADLYHLNEVFVVIDTNEVAYPSLEKGDNGAKKND